MNRSIALSAAAVVLLAACGGKPPAESAQAPPPAPEAASPAPAQPAPVTVENIVEKRAVVEAINLEKRLVTLKADNGEVVTIEVGDQVRNLPQLKVGDHVVARYYEAIGARISTAKTPDSPTIDLAAERAPEGAMPGAAVGQRVTVPVTIVSVANDGKVVSFYGDDGLQRVIEVQRPEGQAFARGLKEGDMVELTYTEALAISVEPVAAGSQP
ncbi:MAG: hypothetical protein IT485_11660 [Gammaproteobacteria bacterium]|nr:hypothetical protein [Gammaproteobacteria bacterium]QOJ32350.1 MAG: hypothetical protein HRU81_09655 [Gammaproteobacteria bacterium]